MPIVQAPVDASPPAGGGDDTLRNAVLLGAYLAVSLGPALAVLALCPGRCERVRLRLIARPVLSTLLGAANLAVVLVAITALSQRGAGEQTCAVLIACGVAFCGIFGLVALSRELGERLLSPAASALKSTSFGWLLLAATGFLPVLGFILLLVAFSAGLGAFVLSFARGPKPPA